MLVLLLVCIVSIGFPAVVNAAVSLVRFYVALSLALSSQSFSRGRDLRREPKIKIVRC